MSKFLSFLWCLVLVVTAAAGEYQREDWPHWKDLDRDCQNTRAEMLIRDSLSPVRFKSTWGCRVVSGEWRCPYTGGIYLMASDIDIDHMVPLANAHRSGGAQWSRAQRKAFANDPDNLFCVEDNTNQSKSDKGPEEWRPPLKSFWPEYARHWIYIKKKYGLRFSKEEREALKEMLSL